MASRFIEHDGDERCDRISKEARVGHLNAFPVIRQKQTATKVIVIFAVIWFNLLIQPCAIASGNSAGGQDCCCCPQSNADDHRGQKDAEAEAAFANVEGAGADCESGAADCGASREANNDGRPVQVKLKDVPSNTSAFLLDSAAVGSAVDASPDGIQHATSNPPSTSAPPLNVLYCVYLN